MSEAVDELQGFSDSQSGAKNTTEALRQHRKKVRQKKQKKQEEAVNSNLRDGIGFVLCLLGVAWLLMLISFDPNDPSFFTHTSKMKAENYLGAVGANIAAFSYQFFGFGSFTIPFASLWLGALCIRGKRVNDWFFQVIAALTVILVIMVFMGSFGPIKYKGDFLLPGGVLGVSLWRFFTGLLNPIGTYLFLVGAAGLSLLIATRLTLREIFEKISAAGVFLYTQTAELGRLLFDRMESVKETRAQERIIKRELEKIDNKKTKTERVTDVDDYIGDPPPVMDLTDEAEPGIDVRNEDLLDDRPLIHEPLAGPSGEIPPWEEMPLTDEESARIPTSDFPTEEPVDVEPEPEFEDEEDESGIRVNPMKPAATQGSFQFMDNAKSDWIYPTSFHFDSANDDHQIDEGELREKAKALQNKLAEFNVTGEMREIHPGPVVTTYEFRPDAGIKYSKVVNLADDLCLALGAESVRIDRMPGRSAIGLEVPNNKRELITFREMIEAETFTKPKSKLLMCLGKTIDGTPFSADLAKMPHLLIAGQTGSGKSVGINAMICSMLMRCSPDEAKFIMIDPKMVELSMYSDIPHLLTPVVTDPHEAANALKWAVEEMERRYRLLAGLHFRNLEHYNKSVTAGTVEQPEGEEPLQPLPFIVVVIDEMADLMMVARGEVEESVARLAQKSRAIGIHLILATQRPSVDIITGVIKSNLPSRLAYRVAQRNDSRIILDSNGADKLLGKGDGLFLGPGTSRQVRIHAPYLSETEVMDLVKFLKNQGKPVYNHAVVKPQTDEEGEEANAGAAAGGGKKKKKRKEDPMYDKASRLVVRSGQASVSYLQRKLSLGYARAAKLIDMMEDDGIVGPSLGSKARDILVGSDYFDGVDGQLR